MGASMDSPAAHAAAISSTPEPTKSAPSSSLDIIDIRLVAVEINLKDEIRSLFTPKDGPRKLPTLLLYNERGLQLFEEVGSSPFPVFYFLGTNCSPDYVLG